jgi:hypothetical protein
MQRTLTTCPTPKSVSPKHMRLNKAAILTSSSFLRKPDVALGKTVMVQYKNNETSTWSGCPQPMETLKCCLEEKTNARKSSYTRK